MKVSELIDILKSADPDSLVVCAQDPEGNGYSWLGQVNENDYSFMSRHCPGRGEIGLSRLTLELEKLGYTEEDLATEDATPCVVLWPV